MNHWTVPELATLRRLREGFLSGSAGAADYWRSPGELALYDATFAERIGWKWDAVLSELAVRGWQPHSRRVLDWGCGSGVASRRILTQWPGAFSSLTLHDRSPLAARYAAERARQEFPAVEIATGPPGSPLPPETLLVVSHVLNELPPAELDRLLAIAAQAREILWVEAGTHADSRRLITDVRERLPGAFTPVAPCTHAARCGMLAPKNTSHWCHHFARPPSAVFRDARWAEWGRELGIDLRSLPYSFLVMERAEAEQRAPAGTSRVIGKPRDYKGYSKVLSCQVEGVSEFLLQKRDASALLREVREGEGMQIYAWELDGQKIAGGQRAPL